MLDHNTKNAIAMLVMADDRRHTQRMDMSDEYLKMAIVCARQLRDVGYSEDIILITNKQEYLDILSAEGIRSCLRSMIDYQALYQYQGHASGLSIFDMQKIHYWSLCGYHKILAIDVDMLPTNHMFNHWHMHGVGAIYNRSFGINSSIMLLQPDQQEYISMLKTIQSTNFNHVSGWNECGAIHTGCIVLNWDFQAANAAQGFIPFYFKDKMYNIYGYTKHCFVHYTGREKYLNTTYINELAGHGFKIQC
jgi:hypothetical protein